VKPRTGLSSATYDGRVSQVISLPLTGRLVRAVLHERRGRRRAGYALAAVLVVGCAAVVAAWLNPFRLLVLEPLSDETVVFVIYGAAAGLAVVTMLVGLRRRLGVALSAATVALALLVTGVVVVNRHLHADDEPGFRRVSEAVVGRSPDGRFEVVTTSQRGDEDADFWFEEYHVESRQGLWSRRSDFIAVLDHPLDDPGPRIDEVRFAGDRAIELRTSDGRQWTVAFDPGSLRVSHWLRSCDEAGGLCWFPLP
jgi:hypothetical protein